MNKFIRIGWANQRGSVLATTAAILAVAGISVGSMLTAAMTYSRVCARNYSYNQAAFLADAGLRAALVKLNYSGEANITYNQSRGYFNQTNTLTATDWGFQSQYTFTNNHHLVVSTGRYNGVLVVVQGEVSLGAGNRSIHALYAHAVFAGNSSLATNFVLKVGGTGLGADFVQGDLYSGGDVELTGDSRLRLAEQLTDLDGNGIWTTNEPWSESYVLQTFTNPISQAAFDTYTDSLALHLNDVYGNKEYDLGEAYVDTIGNGQYDVGEPFTDLNGNGVRDVGDAYIDRNGNGTYDAGVDTVVDHGNGQWDPGEEWTEDNNSTRKTYRRNGTYDPAGGYWKNGVWKTSYVKSGKTYYCTSWPAETYEDVGDGQYTAQEAYTDQNGVYDIGEQYMDDRNGTPDYGTQATGTITGMPSPGPGQVAADGGDSRIDPPDLTHMYYELARTSTAPADALTRWGHDVAVTASDYGTAKAITDVNRPEHIFVRNPPTSGSSGGVSGRSYTALYNSSGTRIDDYFLEDPADASYTGTLAPPICANDNVQKSDGSWYYDVTSAQYLNVQSSANGLVYYVDGNLYIHHPGAFSFRFRQPGTRITIVARGNITISDEFYYNADYPTGADQIEYANFDSTQVNNPSDSLVLIALKNPSCTNSGNILIGDRAYGTGGSIHAMLYAENDFVDNNLNTSSQPYISIFGNMSAGNQVRINRPTDAGENRTRLDVSLDERIRNGTIIVPGLPHPVGTQRSIVVDTAWKLTPGTWSSSSPLQ